jgi:hypothetical protein
MLWTDTPGLAEQNEKHKQDQLQKQKDGKGHWKPELASNSEESVGLCSLSGRGFKDFLGESCGVLLHTNRIGIDPSRSKPPRR